jgi:hypothetical protein
MDARIVRPSFFIVWGLILFAVGVAGEPTFADALALLDYLFYAPEG